MRHGIVVRHHAQVHDGLPESVVRRRRTRIDAGELDIGMTELGAVEEQGEGVEQLTIGPVIRAQRHPLGAAHGIEVGVHIGTAEAEDRLLRITDRDEAMPGERSIEDLPLQPVGVLELVDEDEAVASRQLVGERWAVDGVGECRCEVADEAVVADLPSSSLASFDFGDGVGDATRPRTGQPVDARIRLASRSRIGQHRSDGGEHVPLDVARMQRPARVDRPGTEGAVIERPAVTIGRQGQRRRRQPVEQEVAHDLGDQLGVILEQLDGTRGAGSQAALGQGLLAEAVDRGDRGVVEVGQGAPHPGAATLTDARRASVEHTHPLVVRRQTAAVQVVGGDPQFETNSVAQLGGRGTRVRHDEHVLDVARPRRDRGCGRGPRRQIGPRGRRVNTSCPCLRWPR